MLVSVLVFYLYRFHRNARCLQTIKRLRRSLRRSWPTTTAMTRTNPSSKLTNKRSSPRSNPHSHTRIHKWLRLMPGDRRQPLHPVPAGLHGSNPGSLNPPLVWRRAVTESTLLSRFAGVPPRPCRVSKLAAAPDEHFPTYPMSQCWRGSSTEPYS